MVRRGEEVVEVGEELAKLVGVGIPVGQQRERIDVAQEHCGPRGHHAVGGHRERHADNDEGPPHDELQRRVHVAPHQTDDGRCEKRVGQCDFLHTEQSALARLEIDVT